jgi:hypothetical protein
MVMLRTLCLGKVRPIHQVGLTRAKILAFAPWSEALKRRVGVSSVTP